MGKLRFEFKDSEHCYPSLLQEVDPKLLIVLGFYVRFSRKRGLPCVLTNIIGKFKQSESNTHPEGRAFDTSVRGWDEGDIKDCIEYMTTHTQSLGAVSRKDGIRRSVVYHDVGLGAHFHFQVHKGD